MLLLNKSQYFIMQVHKKVSSFLKPLIFGINTDLFCGKLYSFLSRKYPPRLNLWGFFYLVVLFDCSLVFWLVVLLIVKISPKWMFSAAVSVLEYSASSPLLFSNSKTAYQNGYLLAVFNNPSPSVF